MPDRAARSSTWSERLLGVLHVGTLTPRDFGADDVLLLLVAADRMATALENLRLLEAEREARTRAEAAQERYRALVNGLDRSVVWEADANTLWFSFVNLPAEKLLGFPIVVSHALPPPASRAPS